MSARGQRITADDYAGFIGGLCWMPPGPDRDECVRQITLRLMAMYGDHGLVPPSGLRELARRVGVTAGEGMP